MHLGAGQLCMVGQAPAEPTCGHIAEPGRGLQAVKGLMKMGFGFCQICAMNAPSVAVACNLSKIRIQFAKDVTIFHEINYLVALFR